jgi:hypothetical protein
MAKHTFLAKESNDLVSHCRCEDALITFPAQADCPWCGCGWLFSCQGCRKAFTFARALETDESWESLARRDLLGSWRKEPTDLDVQRWVKAMQSLLADVEPGKSYVTLDGNFLPTDLAGLEIDGWYAHHDLDFVPHVAALQDRSVVTDLLANKKYWLENRLPDDGAN